MTINPYHTTPLAQRNRLTFDEKRLAERQIILNDIARNAVLDNQKDGPLEINIELDPMGNVIVKEYEIANDGITATGKQQRVIRVPQEEAYHRIVEAAQSKIELLERLYEASRSEAHRWFRRSLLSAASEALVLTFSVFVPSLSLTIIDMPHMLRFIVLVISLNILHAGLTLWIFRKTRVANEQVDLYMHSLHEIRSFSSVSRLVARLQLDKNQKQLLQKALVSRSLGLSDPCLNTHSAENTHQHNNSETSRQSELQ